MNCIRIKCRLHFEKFEEVDYGLEIHRVGKSFYKLKTNTGLKKDIVYFYKLEQVKRYTHYFISRMIDDVLIHVDIDIHNSSFQIMLEGGRKSKEFTSFLQKINTYLDDIELLGSHSYCAIIEEQIKRFSWHVWRMIVE